MSSSREPSTPAGAVRVEAHPERKWPRPNTGVAVGILNPWGDVWTYEVFDTPEDARKYLLDFWKGDERHLRGFTCVGVSVTVAAIDTADLWASWPLSAHEAFLSGSGAVVPRTAPADGDSSRDEQNPSPDASNTMSALAERNPQ